MSYDINIITPIKLNEIIITIIIIIKTQIAFYKCEILLAKET